MAEPAQDRDNSGGGSSGGTGDLVRAVPGLARIAVGAWLRTAEWGVETSLRASSRVMRAAVGAESPAELVQDAGAELREYLRRMVELAGAESDAVPGGGDDAEEEEQVDQRADSSRPTPADPDSSPASLRERGAELLRRSAEVGMDEEAHPAYARILDQLAPDEGRILRLLALEGPQPSVDVRSGRWIEDDLIAPGLNMIDAAAGCRNPDRVPVYLNNLNRLGLVWFSREPLDDINRYQVLEVQPEVVEALEKAGRGGRTIRRSIRLTPFGSDFCDACLPLHTAELDQLPASGRGEPDASGERPVREDEGSPR